MAPLELTAVPSNEGRVDVHDVHGVFGMKPKQRAQGMPAKGAREGHGGLQPTHTDDSNSGDGWRITGPSAGDDGDLVAGRSQFCGQMEDGGGHPTPTGWIFTGQHHHVHGKPRFGHEVFGMKRSEGAGIQRFTDSGPRKHDKGTPGLSGFHQHFALVARPVAAFEHRDAVHDRP